MHDVRRAMRCCSHDLAEGHRARPWLRTTTDFAMRRRRVSSVLLPVTWRTCQDLLLYDRPSNV